MAYFPSPYFNNNSYVLPQQQVLQANGKSSIDALRLAPNSSVLIMDTTAPIVWLCTSDGLGAVTAKPYDIAPHEEAQAISIEQRISALEKRLEELNNDKSDGRRNQSKPFDGAHNSDKKHDANS